MAGVSMTCSGMYMSGATIGTERIRVELGRMRPVILERARSGCFVAAPGTTSPGTRGRRTGTGSRRASATSASGSVLRGPASKRRDERSSGPS